MCIGECQDREEAESCLAIWGGENGFDLSLFLAFMSSLFVGFVYRDIYISDCSCAVLTVCIVGFQVYRRGEKTLWVGFPRTGYDSDIRPVLRVVPTISRPASFAIALICPFTPLIIRYCAVDVVYTGRSS